MTQDELDHYIVKGFGIVAKMLEERNARTDAGLSRKVMEIFLGYFHRLLMLKEAYMERPREKDMHPASIEQLDNGFLSAFDNLVAYFERRSLIGFNPQQQEYFKHTLGRFEKCLTGSCGNSSSTKS